MATQKKGPAGLLYSLDSTEPINLPFNEDDHLSFLQKICKGRIEMFFSPDRKHCFYGNEEGCYTQQINKNPDLIKLLGENCGIYGPVFKFDKMPDFF